MRRRIAILFLDALDVLLFALGKMFGRMSHFLIRQSARISIFAGRIDRDPG